MLPTRKYNSKLLLIGEYTVLHGSKALAIPLDHYHGTWQIDPDKKGNSSLQSIKQYLLSLYYNKQLENYDFDQFEYLLAKGLHFNSNIPQGYGAGSSGSITAGIYDLFKKQMDQISLTSLRKELAMIENCYHGNSSGTDPLVSYLNQPILIKNNEIELLDHQNPTIDKNIYLLDTGIQRSTAPFVAAYKETRKANEKFILEMQAIAELNDSLVDAYVLQHNHEWETLIKKLSALQLNTLKMLIPKDYLSIWNEGLESGKYSMKINGAGGGGFLMVYSHGGLPEVDGLVAVG